MWPHTILHMSQAVLLQLRASSTAIENSAILSMLKTGNHCVLNLYGGFAQQTAIGLPYCGGLPSGESALRLLESMGSPSTSHRNVERISDIA